MKKITFLCMVIIATCYFSCKKENAAPVPSKSSVKKELAAGKKDTTTQRLIIVLKDTTTQK
ncbi:MAG TPA: hypothetical protein VIM77_03990 [Mucilaginibacter sp.]